MGMYWAETVYIENNTLVTFSGERIATVQEFEFLNKPQNLRSGMYIRLDDNGIEKDFQLGNNLEVIKA